MVGLNFANEREALQFSKAVDSKINERQEKRASELDISCMYIPYFLVIRHILLISAYLLISACYFADLTTHY